MKRSILLLISLSCIVFIPLLFTKFSFDDYPQIVNASRIHTLQDTPSYFTSTLQFSSQKNYFFGFFYRPFVFTLYALLYALGNGKPLLFHVFQVSLYTVNAVLLFYFFTWFFKKHIAFLLSLIFLIHPVNETIAAYIGDLQEGLFFFFGMLALLTLKNTLLSQKVKPILISFLLLLSVLSKETGILFFIMVLVFVWIFDKKKLKVYTLSLSFGISVYTILRVIASPRYFLRIHTAAMVHTSFFERLGLIPQIAFFYLRELFLPRTFTPSYASIQHVSFLEVWIHIFSLVLFCIILILFGFLFWKKRKERFMYYIFFLLWFLLGILFHLQLFALDVVIAKRWLYFPFVGLLGMIGVLFHNNFLQMKKWNVIYIVCIIALVLVYMVTTMKMNTYWFNIHT